MCINQTMEQIAEAHRMEAGDALENYFSKYGKSDPRFTVKLIEEFDVVSPRRPGFVAQGKIEFMLDDIRYHGKYEVHEPGHPGADDLTFVSQVLRCAQ